MKSSFICPMGPALACSCSTAASRPSCSDCPGYPNHCSGSRSHRQHCVSKSLLQLSGACSPALLALSRLPDSHVKCGPSAGSCSSAVLQLADPDWDTLSQNDRSGHTCSSLRRHAELVCGLYHIGPSARPHTSGGSVENDHLRASCTDHGHSQASSDLGNATLACTDRTTLHDLSKQSQRPLVASADRHQAAH